MGRQRGAVEQGQRVVPPHLPQPLHPLRLPPPRDFPIHGGDKIPDLLRGVSNHPDGSPLVGPEPAPLRERTRAETVAEVMPVPGEQQGLVVLLVAHKVPRGVLREVIQQQVVLSVVRGEPTVVVGPQVVPAVPAVELRELLQTLQGVTVGWGGERVEGVGLCAEGGFGVPHVEVALETPGVAKGLLGDDTLGEVGGELPELDAVEGGGVGGPVAEVDHGEGGAGGGVEIGFLRELGDDGALGGTDTAVAEGAGDTDHVPAGEAVAGGGVAPALDPGVHALFPEVVLGLDVVENVAGEGVGAPVEVEVGVWRGVFQWGVVPFRCRKVRFFTVF